MDSIKKANIVVFILFILSLPTNSLGESTKNLFKPGSEPDGIGDLKWGSHPSVVERKLRLLNKSYEKSIIHMKVKIGEIPYEFPEKCLKEKGSDLFKEASETRYLFYDDKLCVVIIVSNPGYLNFRLLQAACFDKFGKVKSPVELGEYSQYDIPPHPPIEYQWHGKKTTAKLTWPENWPPSTISTSNPANEPGYLALTSEVIRLEIDNDTRSGRIIKIRPHSWD